jgi:uncharacterized protein (DUF2236 family)
MYYTESRLFAALFGIPEACLPPNWEAFVAYNRAMLESEVLTVSAEARAIAGEILKGTTVWLHLPSERKMLRRRGGC